MTRSRLPTRRRKTSGPRKFSALLDSEVRAEIAGEAELLERSMSWVVQAAWTIARTKLWAMKGGKDAEV